MPFAGTDPHHGRRRFRHVGKILLPQKGIKIDILRRSAHLHHTAALAA
jgi:hypothetical protein